MNAGKRPLVSVLLVSVFTLIVLNTCDKREGGTGSVAEAGTQALPGASSGGHSNEVPEPAAAPASSFGKAHRGAATYYAATGKGNCSFDASDDLMVVAINTADYADAALCGGYLNVDGPEGKVTVRVVDRCPGCKMGGLDLSKQAFKQIASLSKGRVPVTWQVVAGTVTGPVEYHYMEGTTRYWTAIQVRNHRWPIASLAIKPKGSAEWIQVKRRRYNYFVYPKPIASGKVKVRITAVTREVLEDELPEPAGGLNIQGHSQF